MVARVASRCSSKRGAGSDRQIAAGLSSDQDQRAAARCWFPSEFPPVAVPAPSAVPFDRRAGSGNGAVCPGTEIKTNPFVPVVFPRVLAMTFRPHSTRCIMLRVTGLTIGFALISTLAYADGVPAARTVAPTGSLRVAIGVGPAASEFWATRDGGSGDLRGVTVELAKAAAAELHVPLQLLPYPNSGEIAAAGQKGAWDLSFMPADPERSKVIDQGPPYVVYISAYLVRHGSAITRLADVDEVGHHVGCVEGTSTSRTVAETLKKATLIRYALAADGARALRDGRIDALAMGRGAYRIWRKRYPAAGCSTNRSRRPTSLSSFPGDMSRQRLGRPSFWRQRKPMGLFAGCSMAPALFTPSLLQLYNSLLSFRGMAAVPVQRSSRTGSAWIGS